MKSLLRNGGLLMASSLCLFVTSFAADKSPFAKVEPIAPGEARWTAGFWADRFELCRTQMVPSMKRLMEGTHESQYLRNFEIAAGLAEGRYRGAPFNDGDFYKWMEAAIASLAGKQNPELEARLDEIISVIAQAQRPDGYLHTPVLVRRRGGDTNAVPFQDRHNFEMYNMGHLFTTAVVHHRATGKTNLLAVARKAADFLYDTFFRGASPEAARSSVCPSHYMGIVDLYRETGEPRYLELAKRFFELRSQISDGGDDNQDRIPFGRQTSAVGHAVRANYLYAGATDLFIETGDQRLWQPVERVWRNLTGQKMYITGGCGALYDGASPYASRDQRSIVRTHQAYGHNYELPNTTAHAETCANIGNVLWNWRMFLATGEARFMDVAELALYNSVLSGVSLDGTNFFYTNPLRVTDPLPTELRWPRSRVPYLSAFCCPPNLLRILAGSAGYAYAKSGHTLWVNLYGGNTLATQLAGKTVRLRQETEYPWNGRVRITVLDSAPFALRLRIPAWARNPVVRLNQAPVPEDSNTKTTDPTVGSKPEPGTYFELRRSWQPGDVLDLDLNMRVRLVEANPLAEEILNQLAVQRGPLVYCLESVDLPYGVNLADVTIPADVDFLARFDQRMLGGIVVLDGTLSARTHRDWAGRLYREFRRPNFREVRTRLIPYYAWANRGPGEMTVWLPVVEIPGAMRGK